MKTTRQSSSARYLRGKTFPGTTLTVTDVTVNGPKRLVHLSDGSVKEFKTAAGFKKQLYDIMAKNQLATAMRGIRHTAQGVTATIGGKLRGERRIYSSKGRAVAALNKIYGRA